MIILMILRKYSVTQISGRNWDMNSRKLIQKLPLPGGEAFK